MFSRARKGARSRRRGVAAVELAILLPVLAFLFVVAVDFARLFYFSLTVMNCARNGAMYGSDPAAAGQSAYKSIEEAALADASNLSPAPTVSSKTVSDANGNHVEVTVTWQFSTVTQFPGVPGTVNLVRTVRMRQSPAVPGFGGGGGDDD
jgi:Flp pilus assembly protein TadG